MAKRLLDVEDFLKLTYTANPQISPNGKNLALTIARSDLEKNKYTNEIHIWDVDKERIISTLTGEGDLNSN